MEKYTGTIEFDGEAALQKWAIYVLKAKHKTKSDAPVLIYGGKVGDNRAGCNPVISRLGNHLSENKIHSQLKNKSVSFDGIENYRVKMYYLHLEDYEESKHKGRLNMINESERELIRTLREVYKAEKVELLNRFTGSSLTKQKQVLYRTYLSDEERARIQAFAKATVEGAPLSSD